MCAMPRKSESDHILQGTRSQALPDKPSLYRAGRPKIPKHLSRVARAEFKRVVGLLEQRGTITPGDAAMVAVLSEVYARWIKAKAEIDETGLMVETTIKDTHGEPVLVRRLNPLLKIVSDCERQIKNLTQQLGLTPATRDRVKPAVGGGQEPDPENIPGTLAYIIKHGDDHGS